jgi:tetratricopeptide (TPR) repeat protein
MAYSRLEILLKLNAENPDDSFNSYALALEYMKDDIAQSLDIFKQLLISNPDFLPTYYQLGKIYQDMEEYDEALEIFRKGCEVAKSQNNTKTLNELNSAILEIEYDI